MDFSFIKNIKDFLRNPLGIIGLFVTIFYLTAAVIFSVGLDKLHGACERLPFVWFIIIFPLAILVAFMYLVCRHHEKLYGPSDFRDEANFVLLSGKEREHKIAEEAEASYAELARARQSDSASDNIDLGSYMQVYRDAESLAVRRLQQIYGIAFTQGVKYRNCVFDAVGRTDDKTYVVECRYLRGAISTGRLSKMLQSVARSLRSLQDKSVELVFVCVLDDYAPAKRDKIVEYCASVSPEIKVHVFDFNELKESL